MWNIDSIRQAIATTCSAHVKQQCGFAPNSSPSQAATRECLQKAEQIPTKDFLVTRNTQMSQLEINNPTGDILEFQKTPLVYHFSKTFTH